MSPSWRTPPDLLQSVRREHHLVTRFCAKCARTVMTLLSSIWGQSGSSQ